ncbi:MAG: molybdopterin-binding protein [Pseudomonadota bacterium]
MSQVPSAPGPQNPTAAMVVIGDEILSGRTRDINMHHLAGRLGDAGFRLVEARVVSDDMGAIGAAVNDLRAQVDQVFTSGGIGPTHDDITADAVGAAFGRPVAVREDALEALARTYKNGRADLNEARLRMARVPEGAVLIENPVSGAPGCSVENVHVMAGVPMIFEAMLTGLLPRLAGGTPVASETVSVRLPEGEIAAPLARVAEAYPDLSLGSYPFFAKTGPAAQLVVRGEDADEVARAAKALRQAFGLDP